MSATLSITPINDAPTAAPQSAEEVLMHQGLTSEQVASLLVQLGQGPVRLPCVAHLHERPDAQTVVKTLQDCAELVRFRSNGLLAGIVGALKQVADKGLGEAKDSQSVPVAPNERLDRSLHHIGWRTPGSDR